MAKVVVDKKFVRPVFPYVTKFCNKTLSVIVQEFDFKYFDATHKLFAAAADMNDGYSKEEAEASFLEMRMRTGRPLLFLEEKTKDIVCVMPLNESPACRSHRAMLSSVATIVGEKFRGKGVVRDAYRSTFPVVVEEGYFGNISRIALSAKNIIPSGSVGSHITGTIPMCSLVDKLGLVDNVLMYKPLDVEVHYPELYKEMVASRNKPLPKLNREDSVVSTLLSSNELPTQEAKLKNGIIQIRPANKVSEVLEAEQLWRAAAESGQGFGIDEFNKNGHFSRKFFKSSDIVVAESTDGEIVGAAIQGHSSLGRTVQPILAQQYLAVKARYQKQGVASALLSYSMETLKKQGYRAMISDTYLNNFIMIDMLRKWKFLFRGSMPFCGFVKDIGPIDSLIVYKEL